MNTRSPAAMRATEGGARRRPRLVGAIVFTLAGVGALLALMTWQIQRLAWKNDLIATLEARLTAPPAPLPAALDAARDEFTRVSVSGRFTGALGAHGFGDAAFLTTVRPWGAGYRIVQPFETSDERLILVDRGYAPVAEKNVEGRASRQTPAPEGPIQLTGALRWPQEADYFAGDAAGPADNVWLTRAVGNLAPLWGAEPVILVAETETAVEGEEWPRPLPVTVDLPNDHLEYAATWGALAAVWAAMGAVLIGRELRRR